MEYKAVYLYMPLQYSLYKLESAMTTLSINDGVPSSFRSTSYEV
jgi:hypothetical protein